MKAVCIVLILVAFQEVVLGEQSCPEGWKQSVVEGKCFRIITMKSTNPDATNYCRKAGGNLASIESAAEQDYVLKYVISEVEDWVRIGGRKNPTTQLWYWEDGTPMNYTNWRPNEENLNQPQGHMYLYSEKGHKGSGYYGNWHASAAGEANSWYFMCQLRLPKAGSNCRCALERCTSSSGCGFVNSLEVNSN